MMMKAGLVLLVALAESAQPYTTITDAGQDKPVQVAAPLAQPGALAQPSAPQPGTLAKPAAQPQQQGNSLEALLGGAAAAQGMTRPMQSPASAPIVSPAAPATFNPMAMPMQPRSGASHHLDLSADSMEVVRGLVEAFMHRATLMPGEKRCLEKNIGAFAGDIMGTVGDIVTATKSLIAGKDAMGGGVMGAGIDGTTKLMSLVTLSTTVLKNCVHGDALDMMKETGRHMINGTYLQHRFLVNGEDIAHSLSDAILAFEAHQFHRFGADIGTSLRKILLSKATGSSSLPEGVPEEDIIQKATEGLMDGFFVRGTRLEVTDTANADVNIVVDLHRCIAGNSMFFKELWMAAWNLFAQISIHKEKHGLEPKQQGQPKWQGELMVAMMQIPMALQKCGVSPDMQRMLMEAIQFLQGLKVHFDFPGQPVNGEEATELMAKAVQAWTDWDFEKFGYELGLLFRQLVMLAFPQKYSIDASGKLWLTEQLEKTSATKQSGTVFVTAIIGGVAALFTAALLVVRAHRLVSKPPMEALVCVADEEGGDLELLEVE